MDGFKKKRDVEIERKFLVVKMPDGLAGPVYQERYYLLITEKTEIRIQKKGEIFELERKIKVDELSREGQKILILRAEFEKLAKKCGEGLERENYVFLDNPDFSVKVYKGRFEGLQRAEFEFDDEEEARKFEPPDWVGREITKTVLGRDSRLVNLTRDEFVKELELSGV